MKSNHTHAPMCPVATVYDAMGERPKATQNKSAPVDVLEILDDLIAHARLGVGERQALADSRAAVAELIEAATRANGEHSAPHDCYATGPLTGNPIADLVGCPGCALTAALARVGGAA